jgi:putative transposase
VIAFLQILMRLMSDLVGLVALSVRAPSSCRGFWFNSAMNTLGSPYRGYRFPSEIISYCVWVYFRFSVSYRDVEELMAERCVTVTYETIRAWCERFGRDYAKRIRARRGKLGDTWHMDEVFIKIGGRLQYLWRAVDQDGSVLDILVQSRRNKKAATRFFKKLLRRMKYAPRVVVTDKLPSLASRPRNRAGLARPRQVPSS